MRKAAPAVGHNQFLVFHIDSEEFGADVLSVVRVLPYDTLETLPDAPEFVEGLLPLQPSSLPVIDLGKRFGGSHKSAGPAARILVVEAKGTRLGILVDSVQEVLAVPDSDLADPPGFINDSAANVLHCVADLGDRLILILDLTRILSSEEIAEVAAMEPGRSPTDEVVE
ncbi:MAG TPA: chemotaxis protein CheW [Longimicrobiaceae bacterium]|nr:chemotaxis protein CheW [Longimicrobiaceae bacterium]